MKLMLRKERVNRNTVCRRIQNRLIPEAKSTRSLPPHAGCPRGEPRSAPGSDFIKCAAEVSVDLESYESCLSGPLQIPNTLSRIRFRMSDFDSKKDYYGILGADERTSDRELERLYKRIAARRHPDKGGSEEEMKLINEAYRVLHNEEIKRDYDAERLKLSSQARVVSIPRASPTAQDVGLFGHGLSALLCLLVGLFLLILVRVQWMFFLWPLLILAASVIVFGVFMARSALRAMNATLPSSNRFRSYTRLHEALFWIAVAVSGYGLYLVLTAI